MHTSKDEIEALARLAAKYELESKQSTFQWCAEYFRQLALHYRLAAFDAARTGGRP